MKLEIPFTIGDQYEVYEKYLESRETIRCNGLDFEVYEYINDNYNKLFGLVFHSNIRLYFNGDILCVVHFNFKGNSYDNLVKTINSYLQLETIRDNRNKEKYYTSKLYLIDDNWLMVQCKNGEKTNLYLYSHYTPHSIFLP